MRVVGMLTDSTFPSLMVAFSCVCVCDHVTEI